MKWSTLILIVIAVIALIGVVIFIIPYEDIERGLRCGDVDYEYHQTADQTVEYWYDPDVVSVNRRIVHDSFQADGRDWIYLDYTFVHPDYSELGRYGVFAFSPEDLRRVVEKDHEKGIVPEKAWHWFDCTICATQGECGGTRSEIAPDEVLITFSIRPESESESDPIGICTVYWNDRGEDYSECIYFEEDP